MIWTRDDVSPLTTSSRAGEHVAYTVVKDGEDGQALLVFDPADGHTVNSYPLPDATGWPVGVSIGHDRRVVAVDERRPGVRLRARLADLRLGDHPVDRRRGIVTDSAPADSGRIAPWPKKKISVSFWIAKFS